MNLKDEMQCWERRKLRKKYSPCDKFLEDGEDQYKYKNYPNLEYGNYCDFYLDIEY